MIEETRKMIPTKRSNKVRLKAEHNLNDAYKYYKKTTKPIYFDSKFSKSNNHLILDKKTYMSLNKEALKLFKDKILSGDIVNLPNRLGNLSVVKSKQHLENLIRKNKCALDWINSKKYKKKIVNFNDHTDGYIYRFVWRKSNANAKNVYEYKFIPCRALKRELARYIKVLKKDYREPIL